MPSNSTTSWWAFPPSTQEVQLDEKWSFVAKKEKHCDRADAADDWCGDHWDHVALDAEHRLVLSVVSGRQSADHAQLLVEDVQRRTGGRPLRLFTSDETPSYATAILAVYGQEKQRRRQGKRGRKPKPVLVPPQELTYATVHKTRKNNRVVKVEERLVYGSKASLRAALAGSSVSGSVNTVFVERQHGTDRNRNARKVRKTYAFSKDWWVHEAMTSFTLYSYNFCWPVRTLRQGSRRQGYRPRTPARTAGLTDHVWTLKEWLSYPAVQRK